MRAKKEYKKNRKRIGRGPGSGHGKTSTKGHKGQGARSGVSMSPQFEGGQTPFYRRVAKRGFTNPTRKNYSILNLDQLEALGVAEVSPEWLVENDVIDNLRDGLKILARGSLKQKLTVRAHRFSAPAKAAIEKAGGQAVLIESKKTA